jgi:carbamoyltransferase
MVVAAAEEERFTRVKHAPGCLPTMAIARCLNTAGIGLGDVDVVVFAGASYINMATRLRSYLRHTFGHAPRRVELVDHHHAHAASAFYSSGEASALILTFDFSGDGLSTTVNVGEGRSIRRLDAYRYPQSLGAFYAMITQYLGFDFGEDEYKVMGLASYGRDTIDLSWLLSVDGDRYRFSEAYLSRPELPNEPSFSTQECLYRDALIERLGPPRVKGAPFEGWHEDIACSAQSQLERVVLRLAEAAARQSGQKVLCLAGGVALNCVMNQRLAESGFFDRVYVPPVSGDAGLAMGGALCIAADEGLEVSFKMRSAALGPEYSASEIRKAIAEVKVPFREISDPARVAAKMLTDGQIVGWFQGRMEYGPRALGQRSILADPRRVEMKDRVNAVVKFREGFRPFAPSATLEGAPAWFERVFESPFMTVTFDVKRDRRDSIPAVTHVDGTARVQTVRSEDSPLYHQLLTSFAAETSVPVVLNTSFNVRGQPIVESPNQAISTFYGSGLDALLIGNFLLRKEGQ